MLHVNIKGTHVASINKQHKAADTFDPANPWLLLRLDGRVHKHPTAAAARKTATDLFAPCTFTKS